MDPGHLDQIAGPSFQSDDALMLLSEQTAGQQPLHSTPRRIGRSQKGGRHQPTFATRTIRRKYAIRAGGSLLGTHHIRLFRPIGRRPNSF